MLARAPELHIDRAPIPSSWTSWGKDLRALAAEPHVRQGRARIAAASHSKTSMLKGVDLNHLLAQLAGFRIGDKAAPSGRIAMISTETAATSPEVKRGSGPQMDQTAKATSAIAITSGTNQPET